MPQNLPEEGAMSKTEILDELPNLSRNERREILQRLIELDEDADSLEECRQSADATFRLLDVMEAEDDERKSR